MFPDEAAGTAKSAKSAKRLHNTPCGEETMPQPTAATRSGKGRSPCRRHDRHRSGEPYETQVTPPPPKVKPPPKRGTRETAGTTRCSVRPLDGRMKRSLTKQGTERKRPAQPVKNGKTAKTRKGLRREPEDQTGREKMEDDAGGHLHRRMAFRGAAAEAAVNTAGHPPLRRYHLGMKKRKKRGLSAGCQTAREQTFGRRSGKRSADERESGAVAPRQDVDSRR